MKSRFDEKELAELVYDKLANNDEFEMFEPFMADDMVLVLGNRTGEKCKIALTSGDTEFVLTLERHEKGDFEIFENEPTLRISGGEI